MKMVCIYIYVYEHANIKNKYLSRRVALFGCPLPGFFPSLSIMSTLNYALKTHAMQ